MGTPAAAYSFLYLRPRTTLSGLASSIVTEELMREAIKGHVISAAESRFVF
jgi:hypothetical protein